MSAARPRISAVVLDGEQSGHSAACVQALSAGTVTPDEIVCVGTNSQDPVAAGGLAVTRVPAPRGATWAEACNLGLAHATGEFLAVLDGGCQVGPGWMELLTAFLAEHPDAGAAEGRRTSGDTDPTSPLQGGHLEVNPVALTWTTRRDRSLRLREVACLSRHAFVLRRSALDRVGAGPLDRRFGDEMAGHDLFARFLERGWRLYQLPAADFHFHADFPADGSPDRWPPGPDRNRERDRLLFAWKHLSRRQRDHQVALANRQANHGLRGWVSPPSTDAPATRAALAWLRTAERQLDTERTAGGVPDGAFAAAVDAAQSRANYFFHVRQEILDLIPASAKVVVDVGCAAGVLGEALKRQRPEVQIRGVELSPQAAAKAREVLDDVHCGSADDALPATWPRPDCVVFADVLEHMPDPWSVLRRYHDLLGKGGTVVVSVPNIGHRTVLEGLVHGKFEYTDAGILDRTHLRFFTRASAIELLQGSGFHVERIVRNEDRPGQELWLRTARRLFSQSAFLQDFHAVQLILVGKAI